MAKIYKCLRIKSAHKAESALVEDFWGKQANVVALLISERLGIMRLLTWLLLFTAVFLRRFCGLQKMSRRMYYGSDARGCKIRRQILRRVEVASRIEGSRQRMCWLCPLRSSTSTASFHELACQSNSDLFLSQSFPGLYLLKCILYCLKYYNA